MKNNRIIKIIFTLTIALTYFYNTIVNTFAVTEPPKTIDISSSAAVKGYIGEGKNINFGTKTLKDGTLAYCLDYNKKTPVNTTGTLLGEMDAGITYLIENGYPNKNITGKKEIDYYITQTAIWWYLDETTGSTNLNDAFKTTDSDPQNIRPTIITLKNAAIEAKKKGYKNPQISTTIISNNLIVSKDKQYYISNDITVNLTDLDNYTASLVSAPDGSYITDATGNKKTTFQKGETFKVYVPSKSLNSKKADIKVSITSNTTYNKTYQYAPPEEAEQRLLPAILYPTTINKNIDISLNASSSRIKIIKIDASTSKPLAGAKLVVKDKESKVVATFTTTEEAYILTDLEDGIYTVTEESAPKGYALNDKVYTFTIDQNNREQQIIVENYPAVEVPDTLSNSMIMYGSGSLIILFGIGFVIYNAKKKQSK